MFILILLFTITTGALEINVTNCPECNNQTCVYDFYNVRLEPFSSVVSDLNKYCICSNETCGSHCQKRYYTKEEILACVKSKNFFCSLAIIVNKSQSFAMSFLFAILMAIVFCFSLWLIVLTILYKSYRKVDEIPLSTITDVERNASINEGRDRLLKRIQFLAKISIILCIIVLIPLIVLIFTLIKDANNLEDKSYCF